MCVSARSSDLSGGIASLLVVLYQPDGTRYRKVVAVTIALTKRSNGDTIYETRRVSVRLRTSMIQELKDAVY